MEHGGNRREAWANTAFQVFLWNMRRRKRHPSQEIHLVGAGVFQRATSRDKISAFCFHVDYLPSKDFFFFFFF